MRFAHILARVTGQPWLITPEALASLAHVLEARINALPSADAFEKVAPAQIKTGPTVAVIPVHGILAPRLSIMEAMCGGCDTELVRQAFDSVNADPAVKGIVMHFDSPGGLATGCHELYTHLYGAKSKPLYAFTDGLLCSAAYYLAAACDTITTTPTAQVGSIGTIMMVREERAKDGTKLHVFKSGEYKDIGSPDHAPSEKERAIFQSRVDHIGGLFRADVSRARPSVPAEAMEGLSYFGGEASDLRLADSVVNDFAAFLDSIS